MSIRIRRGVKEDMKDVIQLNNELESYQGYFNGQEISAEDLIRDGALEPGATNPPLFYSFIAEEETDSNEKHAIGFAIAYDTYSTWWGRSLCLYNLYVRDGYRGKGVGKQLFTEVVRHARDSGCTRVDFQVLDWNPFQKFYEDLNAVNLTKAEGWQMFYMTEKDIKKALDEHGG